MNPNGAQNRRHRCAEGMDTPVCSMLCMGIDTLTSSWVNDAGPKAAENCHRAAEPVSNTACCTD